MPYQRPSNRNESRSKIYRRCKPSHCQHNDGVLPSLGVKFLALLYRCIDEADFATLIVEYKDDELIGFVTGTLGTSSLYKLMVYHPVALLAALIPVIFDLNKIKKVINILKHISGSDRANYPKAELLTICVNRDYRRLGVADDLYIEN